MLSMNYESRPSVPSSTINTNLMYSATAYNQQTTTTLHSTSPTSSPFSSPPASTCSSPVNNDTLNQCGHHRQHYHSHHNHHEDIDQDTGIIGTRLVSSSSSSTLSAMDLHYLYDQDQYPSPETFDAIVQDYLQNLSSKKRDKALVDEQRYALILQVLKDPRNTAISTAQFRFWVKKMFQLSPIADPHSDQFYHCHLQQPITSTTWAVCHDNKPVAMQEQIYPILIRAHREAHHGGRDKTSALVRKQYSWIPKELIARFVRRCPFCISRRNGHLTRLPRHQLNHPSLLSSFSSSSPSTPITSPSKSSLSTVMARQFNVAKTTKPKNNGAIGNAKSGYYHDQHNDSNTIDRRHIYPRQRRCHSLKIERSPKWMEASVQQDHHQETISPSSSASTVVSPVAASIATTAAATVVSSQWMEPGTPFYYYSQTAPRDLLATASNHRDSANVTNKNKQQQQFHRPHPQQQHQQRQQHQHQHQQQYDSHHHQRQHYQNSSNNGKISEFTSSFFGNHGNDMFTPTASSSSPATETDGNHIDYSALSPCSSSLSSASFVSSSPPSSSSPPASLSSSSFMQHSVSAVYSDAQHQHSYKDRERDHLVQSLSSCSTASGQSSSSPDTISQSSFSTSSMSSGTYFNHPYASPANDCFIKSSALPPSPPPSSSSFCFYGLESAHANAAMDLLSHHQQQSV